MTTPPTNPSIPANQAGRPTTAKPRRVHLVLRDGAVLDARIFLSEGQTLALFLGSRKGGWVNLVDVVWAANGEQAPHLVLQTEHLALAASIDGDIPAVVGSAVTAQRWVHLGLDDGTRLQGSLFLAERQRLSDYLYTVGKFMPMTRTTRLADGVVLGDVAVNCAAVKLVRDVAVPSESEAPPAPVLTQDYSVFVVEDMPVTREAIRTNVGSLTLLTPGRLPDRRAGESRPRPNADLAGESDAPVELPPLTADQMRGAERAARHWLGSLATRHVLAEADPRRLSAAPSTAEIWRALCAANELVEEDIAAMIADACKLPLAAFEDIDARAIALIPGRIARRLQVLPVREAGNMLCVATCDPLNAELEQQLRFAVKQRVMLCVAPPTALENAISWWYPDTADGAA